MRNLFVFMEAVLTALDEVALSDTPFSVLFLAEVVSALMGQSHVGLVLGTDGALRRHGYAASSVTTCHTPMILGFSCCDVGLL